MILQICGACHDAANDPGFEFEVEQKIEAQKHGTKPPQASAPGAGARSEPKASEADRAALQSAPSALRLPSANAVGALERGFAQSDPRS